MSRMRGEIASLTIEQLLAAFLYSALFAIDPWYRRKPHYYAACDLALVLRSERPDRFYFI